MRDLLEKSGFFAALTPDELGKVAGICEIMNCKRGELIFAAQSPAHHMYVIVDGVVDLRFEVRHYEATKEITLDRKFSGEAFGWSALSRKSQFYTLSAVAVKDTQLLKFHEQDLQRLCESNSHLGYVFMKSIAEIISERFVAIQMILIDIIQKGLEDKEG